MTEEQAWVFDSLVCFLHGPVWNAPIQNFIEEKSIIFDSNDLDENNSAYKNLHEEYKNLVDFMLGSFMEELQITTEQFEVACLGNRMQNDSAGIDENTKDISFSFHQGLFQQIWAANDIRIFIKMMMRRNLELQIQALDLIERQQHLPSANQSNDKSEEQANESLYNDGKIPDEDFLCQSNISTQCLPNENVSEKSKDILEAEKFKRLNLFFDHEKIDTRAIHERQKYLRAQRDKILQVKKQVRTRQLNETMIVTGRPQSASIAAAKILLDDKNKDGTKLDSKLESSTLRITLARRLKSEIIDAASEKNE
ncbi:cilia- and flagella-associated protein 36 [Culicoides brevitarsis]|uniref:cilia- and flagella-associated protein 36 n=1 Tax=Culicoides brevitarsis TaxID=469753 RepID=UPI00307C7EA0